MVFGLFSKEKSLSKTIERATNKLAQQPDRLQSLEKLKEDGSDAALFGLCRRFGITSQKAVEDEWEKHWVVDTLVGHGAAALPPLVRYMKSSDHLSFPLRVLERIGDKAKVLEIADELFATEAPGYVRMPDRRIDLIRWFREWKPGTDAEIVQRLTPYVTDFDENSRSAAIEGMAGRDPALIGAPLIAALLRPEEESGRIKRQILEVLAASNVPLGDQAAGVGAALRGPLSDDFRVDGDMVKKR
jgi:hypothetical protein